MKLLKCLFTQNRCYKNGVRITPKGTYVNINSCTADLFEDVLNEKGIKFDRIA